MNTSLRRPKVLYLHGWTSVPGGVKPRTLLAAGHEIFEPALPDDDFAAAVEIARTIVDTHRPDAIVGSSRGGAVAMNVVADGIPRVLLCPAWRRWGTATTVPPNTLILHAPQDEVIPFADSAALAAASHLPVGALRAVGRDHRLADAEPLAALVAAVNEVVARQRTGGRGNAPQP